jgi:hypothetical protein
MKIGVANPMNNMIIEYQSLPQTDMWRWVLTSRLEVNQADAASSMLDTGYK